jgi:methylated-DNA-[protein]-cysteine S-methyltransferase
MSGSRHVRHTIVDSPVGPLTLVGDGTVLFGLYFDGHLRTPRLTDLGPRADRGFDAAARRVLRGYPGPGRGQAGWAARLLPA